MNFSTPLTEVFKTAPLKNQITEGLADLLAETQRNAGYAHVDRLVTMYDVNRTARGFSDIELKGAEAKVLTIKGVQWVLSGQAWKHFKLDQIGSPSQLRVLAEAISIQIGKIVSSINQDRVDPIVLEFLHNSKEELQNLRHQINKLQALYKRHFYHG